VILDNLSNHKPQRARQRLKLSTFVSRQRDRRRQGNPSHSP